MKPLRRAALLLAGLLFAACGQDAFDPRIRETVEVQGFRSCGDLESYIKEQAAREMNATLDAILRQYVGGSGAPTALPAPVPLATTRDAGQDYTTTNTQERGVDEADFVKNDGSRIFILHDRQLVVLSAWPAVQTRIESATPLEGDPFEMFLEKDRVVVFSRVSLKQVFERAGLPWPPTSFGEDADTTGGRLIIPCLRDGLYCYGYDGLKVTVLDVAGPAPALLHEQYFEGRYLSSRRVGPSVRIVSGSRLHGPALRYWPDRNVDWKDPAALRAAFERLRAQNLDRIRSSTLKDWLPHRVELIPGQAPRDLSQQCSDFHATRAPVRLGLTTVSTLRLDRPGQGMTHTSILNDSGQVYASRESLYLVTPHYWFFPWAVRESIEDHSYLHKFDIARDPARVRYVASGGVPGHILNQFSMDEENGLLRVATTRRRFDQSFRQTELSNSVFVLATKGGRLEETGRLTGLAPGEQIFSARFEGSRGYVVTYRQVDPLLILDLSNPGRPLLRGELKVPGFSTYIHPMDAGHLLTIGYDTTETGGGLVLRNGLQLQVFDVSDPASPKLRHKLTIGSASSFSEAAYEHRAFNFFPSRAVLAIPFSDWSPSRSGRAFRSSLEVFRVRLGEGIEPLGSIDHADLTDPDLYRGYPWRWTPTVRRSVMIEDFVYSISFGGVKVNALNSLGVPLATVRLPDPLPWNRGDP